MGCFQGAGQGACADSPRGGGGSRPSHCPGWEPRKTPPQMGQSRGAHGLPWVMSPQPCLWMGTLTPGVRWGKVALSPMKGFAHVAPRPTSGLQETLPRLSPSPCLHGCQPGRVDVPSQSQRGTPRDLTPSPTEGFPGAWAQPTGPRPPALNAAPSVHPTRLASPFSDTLPQLRCSGAPRSPLTELEKDTHLPRHPRLPPAQHTSCPPHTVSRKPSSSTLFLQTGPRL